MHRVDSLDMDHRLHMLVLGQVPEANALDERDWPIPLDIERIASVDELEAALDADAFDLTVSATSLEHLDSSQIVECLKAHAPYRPAIMIGDPREGPELLEACRCGLDEKVVRPADPEASAELLAIVLERHLESYMPRAAVMGSKLRVALRRAVYDQVLDAFALLDPNKRILYYNRAGDALARHILGQPLTVGEQFVELYQGHIKPELGARIEANIEQALDGEESSLYLEEPTSDGLLEIRQYHFAPVRDHRGRVIAACLVARDVRDLHEVEEKLEESEARFWHVFEHLPVGATIVDRNGRWAQVNPTMQELLGYDEDELIGRSPLELTHEEDVEHNRRYLERLLGGKDDVFRLQKRFYHRSGDVVWTDVIGIPIRRGTEKAQRYLGIISDITQQRQLDEQLQEAEKMRLVGQVAGGTAHDFNNLLTVITSYTHYALCELGEDTSIAFALRKVLEAAERGSSMTDQLLAFSRRQHREPEPLDLNEVIEDDEAMLLRLLRPQAELVIDLHEEPVPVCFDRGQLEQIVFNLVINARDAMPEGGEVTIASAPVELTEPKEGQFETISAGQYGQLIVRDTGEGIPPDVLEHIFEPFYTTKEVGQGTGLGLASSWGIIKQANGYIDVDTEVDRGTTFTVYMPAADEGLEKAEPETTPRRHEKNGATVLLVEDDLEVREALRRFLDRQGFRVLEADSGNEALACSREYSDIIDILLSDVVMPGLSGTEMARQLQEERPDTCIILMSGYPGQRLGEIEEDWKFLRKPLDLGRLARELEAVVTG